MKRNKLVLSAFAAALTLAAIGAGPQSAGPQSAGPQSAGPQSASAAPSAAPCGADSVVPASVPVAPASARVDTGAPVFSNPTSVTNPLFPVSSQESVLMLGMVDGEPFRTEVTLLPTLQVIDCGGSQLHVLTSQYMAFLGGRIEEVALDYYGQDDAGNVWYFGEDVSDYVDGVVSSTEGTWRAGRGAPAAMIMPANPQVGNVYRSENAYPLVFEEVTISAVNQTVQGPRGPVTGAIIGTELHLDGMREDKTFAPGYGEFFTGGGGDTEALALAVPTDALPGSPPATLATMVTAANAIYAAAADDDWPAASDAFDELSAAWDAYKAGAVPPLIKDEMDGVVDELDQAVGGADQEAAQQAAIDTARTTHDLRLRYQPAVEIDFARFELLTRQVLLDAAANDPAGVLADVTTLEWTFDRFSHGLTAPDSAEITALLDDLRAAADAGDVDAAATTAEQLLDVLATTSLPVVAPPPVTPPAATPTRPTGVVAPDTGDGGDAFDVGSPLWIMIGATGAILVALGGAGVIRHRGVIRGRGVIRTR